MWVITVQLEKNKTDRAAAALETFTDTVSIYEREGAWGVEAYTEFEPALEIVTELMDIYEIDIQSLLVEKLPEKDWLAENRQSFQPLEIGGFVIHPADYDGDLPADKKALHIEASQAFGTGRHATTEGCLILLETVMKGKTPRRILDLGCGTAVLAMAAQHLFPEAHILASDIDDPSVALAAENTCLNGYDQVECVVSDGFKNQLLSDHAPYDLVMANILAEPLADMAQDIIQRLAVEGRLILSGFFEEQWQKLLSAYQPLSIVETWQRKDGNYTWMAAALQKTA